MRKLLSIILAVVMLASMMTVAIPASADTQATFAEQMETEATELYIYNEADFVAFLTAARAAKATFAGKTIYLETDITLNDEWVAAYPADITTTAVAAPTEADKVIFGTPAAEHGFAGTLDGNGHTVKGIYAADAEGVTPAARTGSLFGRATNATIKNIRFEKCYIESALASMGGFFGILGANTTSNFINVYNGIDLKCNHAGAAEDATATTLAMGGFVGYNGGNINFTNCVYAGTMMGNSTMGRVMTIGGFVGVTIKKPTVTLVNCAYTGAINFPSAVDRIGKFMGRLENVASNARTAFLGMNMYNCVAGGNVVAAEGVGENLVGNVQVRYTTTTEVNVNNVIFTAARTDAPVLPAAVVAETPTCTYTTKNYKQVESITAETLSGAADVEGETYDLTPYFTMTSEGPMPTALLGMGEGTQLENGLGYLGYQVKAVEGGYAIRFIGEGAFDDAIDSVGLRVGVEGGNLDGLVSKKSSTTKVYKGLIVGAEGGEDDYVAADGNFVYTINVGTFTADMGVITVYVTVFGDAGEGEIACQVKTITIDTSKLPELAG